MGVLSDLVDTHYRGLEAGDLDLAASPFAADVATEFPSGPMQGVDALRGLIQVFITAFPDMKLTRRNTWESGDTAVAELTFSGTHTGPLGTPDGEVPPSGKPLTFGLIDTFTVRDGKIVEHRGYWDNVTFLSQLGLLGG